MGVRPNSLTTSDVARKRTSKMGKKKYSRHIPLTSSNWRQCTSDCSVCTVREASEGPRQRCVNKLWSCKCSSCWHCQSQRLSSSAHGYISDERVNIDLDRFVVGYLLIAGTATEGARSPPLPLPRILSFINKLAYSNPQLGISAISQLADVHRFERRLKPRSPSARGRGRSETTRNNTGNTRLGAGAVQPFLLRPFPCPDREKV